MNATTNERFKSANRLRCISVNGATAYLFRIEDPGGQPLSEFVERSAEEAREALNSMIILGWLVKENLTLLRNGDEDFRMPIANEEMLRGRLYG